MQVGVSTIVAGPDDVEFVRACEQVGVTSVGVPEAWGYDALTPLSHLAATTLVMPVAVEFTDDPEEAGRRHADGYAFTIGAMGAPGRNFYSRAFTQQGCGDEVQEVSELWQAGRRAEAAAKVPFDIGFTTNLLGTADMIRDRVRLYRDVGITTLQAKVSGTIDERVDTVARLVEIAAEVRR